MKFKPKITLTALWLAGVLCVYIYLNPWPLGHLGLSLGALLVMLAAALGSGLKILNWIKLKTDTFLETLSLSVGLGLGVLYVLSMLLGLGGLYGRVYVYPVLFILIFICRPDLWRWLKDTGEKFRRHSKNRFSFIGALFLILLSAALGYALIISLSPPSGEHALSGSAAAAARYIGRGRIFTLPYSHLAHLPPGMSMLQALGLLILPRTGFRTISVILLFLLAAGVYSMTRKFFHRKIALFALAITVSTPALINFYTTDHPFMGSVTFGFLALYCFICWASDSSALEGTSRKWIIISGVFAALSLSFGFFSMFLPMTLIVMIIYVLWTVKHETTFQQAVNHAAWFLIPFIGALIPMGIKNLVFAANPFYPFFSPSAAAYGIPQAAQSLWGYLTPLWNIPFTDSAAWGNFFLMGPLYIIFLPAAFAIKEAGKIIRILIGFASVYLLLYIIAGRAAGYIYFLIPVLSIITAYIIVNLYGQKKYFYHFVMAVFFMGILLNFHLLLEHSRGAGSVYFAMGLESKEEYLDRRVPGYGVFEYINENTPPGSKVLVAGDRRTFYINRALVAPDGFAVEPALDMVKKGGSVGGFVREAEKKDITHLLVRENFDRYWDERHRLIFSRAKDEKMEILYRHEGYVLYELL